jgi:Stage II sporulation protein E (SpoIIE)
MSPVARWFGRGRRYEMLRNLGWRQGVTLYAAVFCTFSVLGFFIDLSGLEQLTPWPTVLATVALTSLSSVMFLAGAIRGRGWFLAAFGLMGVLILLERMLPGGADPAVHPPTIAQLATRARIDGFGCLLGAVFGYTLFVQFIARQGTRMVRLDTEIALARDIHSALAPPIARRVGRLELAGRSLPSSEVGGDLLDAFERADTLVACVADVSGHGVPASTLMAMVRSAIRVRLDGASTLEALCGVLHKNLLELGRPDRFVTLAALRFGADGRVELVNAGHPPILRLRRGAAVAERFGSLSVPLGVPGDHRFGSGVTEAIAGDRFVLFTDGVSETADRSGQQFGIEGIERILHERRDDDSARILDAIEHAARSHGRTDDDQTLLVIRIRDDEEVGHGT